MTLLGLKKQMNELETYLNDQEKMGIIIFGPTGSGKTSVVYQVCNELGLDIIDYDIDQINDHPRLASTIRSSPMNKSVYLLDDLYKVNNGDLIEIVNNASNKIIFISDSIKTFSNQLRKKCHIVKRFWGGTSKYGVRNLIDHAKEHGMTDFSKGIPPDFRQAELMGEYGSEGYSVENGYYAEIKESLKNGSLSERIDLNFRITGLDEPTLIMILDNISEYYGIKKLRMLRRILVADRCRRHEPLTGFDKINIDRLKHYYHDKKKEIKRINYEKQ